MTMSRESKLREWSGIYAIENDGGWTEEVWNTGWDSALLEAAERLEKMFPNGDTIQSVVVWLRNMKEE